MCSSWVPAPATTPRLGPKCGWGSSIKQQTRDWVLAALAFTRVKGIDRHHDRVFPGNLPRTVANGLRGNRNPCLRINTGCPVVHSRRAPFWFSAWGAQAVFRLQVSSPNGFANKMVLRYLSPHNSAGKKSMDYKTFHRTQRVVLPLYFPFYLPTAH